MGKRGFYQNEYTPGLWIHKTQSTAFSIGVDNFGVKYAREEDKKHLLDILNQHYKFTIDNKGTQYMGITLEWDHKNRRVHLSIPGYVPKALKTFGHEPTTELQDQPYPHASPNYGAKIQYSKAIDNSHQLTKEDKCFVMQIIGTLLLYEIEIDSTMIPDSSTIACIKNAPTKNTTKQVKQLLYYSASQDEAIITFNKSGMVMEIHYNEYYLSKNNACCCAGGHHFLSSDDKKKPKQRRHTQPINNHPQRNVISSRGRTWIIIFEFQTRNPYAQETRRSRPSATTNAHTNEQQNSRRPHQ